MKKVFLIILCSFILILSGCKNQDDKAQSISTDEYNPSLDGYVSSFLAGANTDTTPDDMKPLNMLYMQDNQIINLECGASGSNPTIVLKVFYDYQAVDFQVVGEDKYTSEYVFKLEDKTKINIPIILDSGSIVPDDKIHKVIFAFLTGYDKNASEFDQVTSEYGLTVIYDVVNTLDYKDEVFIPIQYGATLPDNNFDVNIAELIFNIDYENNIQKTSGGVLNPTPSIATNPDTIFPLMYNFGKESKTSALLLLTLNFEQIQIDGQQYKLIKLDGAEGTANGQIDITTPKEPGKYEVIGFLVQNPFEKNTNPSAMVPMSIRFTLNVE